MVAINLMAKHNPEFSLLLMGYNRYGKKIILLVFAAFLGAGIVMLVQWMRPPTEDPYFFLNPKVTEDHPIEIPIKLYKKGEK
ncbi:hypothetical protein KKJ25_19130 [Xenorhabdus bovienii]|uniref:hypothetical protein n=1 Tax=Xenorhabdus bovienii TaxID=40576 RepID=UPI00237C7A42|nr:hypothetical protein [Xenorhabdus bovienii]MDE1496983.1 hypothetical protein [Xenorhabdus bovienii]